MQVGQWHVKSGRGEGKSYASEATEYHQAYLQRADKEGNMGGML